MWAINQVAQAGKAAALRSTCRKTRLIVSYADVKQLTTEDLAAGMENILKSPKDDGVLRLIVRRPATGEREVLAEGRLDLTQGLSGDNWSSRANSSRGVPNPDMQITIMNSRVIALVAAEESRWPLAGDQLYVDLDLSTENLPIGSQLAIGQAIIEITPPPHNGCKKFLARFGSAAVDFVNSPRGKELHLRGVNAKVVAPGLVRAGDSVRKIRPAASS
jgi:hypothetical protein